MLLGAALLGVAHGMNESMEKDGMSERRRSSEQEITDLKIRLSQGKNYKDPLTGNPLKKVELDVSDDRSWEDMPVESLDSRRSTSKVMPQILEEPGDGDLYCGPKMITAMEEYLCQRSFSKERDAEVASTIMEIQDKFERLYYEYKSKEEDTDKLELKLKIIKVIESHRRGLSKRAKERFLQTGGIVTEKVAELYHNRSS